MSGTLMATAAWCRCAVLAAAACLATLPAVAQSAYGVYCANGRIEVDGRSLDQMRSARGSGTCAFGSFSTRSSAEDLARRQFGGAGSACSCGSGGAPSQEGAGYGVYCANGRIEVDNRSLDQMRSARGSDTCRFGHFAFRGDAEDLARRQFGGSGNACNCGR